MKISKAVQEIKDQHKVEYSESLVVVDNIIIVGIVFKSYKVMHSFFFAWCSAIRLRTDQQFSITAKYFKNEGELTSFTAYYRPHNARRGIDKQSTGEQRAPE